MLDSSTAGPPVLPRRLSPAWKTRHACSQDTGKLTKRSPRVAVAKPGGTYTGPRGRPLRRDGPPRWWACMNCRETVRPKFLPVAVGMERISLDGRPCTGETRHG